MGLMGSSTASLVVLYAFSALGAPHPQESSPSQPSASIDGTTIITIAATGTAGEAPTDTFSLVVTAPIESSVPPSIAPGELSTTTTAYTRVPTTVGESVIFTSAVDTAAATPSATATRPSVRPGTNYNADTLERPQFGSGGFGLTGGVEPDYLENMRTFATQPEMATPINKSCMYSWTPVLGGMGTMPLGEVWALPEWVWLVPEDSRQGQICNCGLGASVMALANFDRIKFLTRSLMFWPDQPKQGDRSLVAIFRNNGDKIVLMDDTLPVSADQYCTEYLGYQPVLDAVRKNATGQYPLTNVFFMPFLEKAWAKYLNAYPQYRWEETAAIEGAKGYAGMEGTPPHFALAALTGGKPHREDRQRGKHDMTSAPYQPRMLVAAYQCIFHKYPCVIGTPLAKDLGILGELDSTSSVWIGNSNAPMALAARLSYNDSNPSFVAYDFHNLVQKDGKDYSTMNILVGGHAYTVDQSASSWHSDLSKGRVTLLNPWGCNPKYGDRNNDGYCDVQKESPRQITLSLSAFINLVWTIYWVDELPSITW